MICLSPSIFSYEFRTSQIVIFIDSAFSLRFFWNGDSKHLTLKSQVFHSELPLLIAQRKSGCQMRQGDEVSEIDTLFDIIFHNVINLDRKNWRDINLDVQKEESSLFFRLSIEESSR